MSPIEPEDGMEIDNPQTKQNTKDMLSALNEIHGGGGTEPDGRSKNSGGESDSEEMEESGEEGSSGNDAEGWNGSGNGDEIDHIYGEVEENPDNTNTASGTDKIIPSVEYSTRDERNDPAFQRNPPKLLSFKVNLKDFTNKHALCCSAWEEIIKVCQGPNNNEELDKPTPTTNLNELPCLPKDWATHGDQVSESHIDIKRLISALDTLHVDMKGLLVCLKQSRPHSGWRPVLCGLNHIPIEGYNIQPGFGYMRSKARNSALVQVALSYANMSDFDAQVEIDHAMWRAKTSWVTNYEAETLAMSKTMAAIDVLKNLDIKQRDVANVSIIRKSSDFVHQWKSKAASDPHRNAFPLRRQRAQILLGREFITDMEKLREIDCKISAGFQRQSKEITTIEHVLIMQEVAKLEPNAKVEVFERAEAFALAMMEGFVEGRKKITNHNRYATQGQSRILSTSKASKDKNIPSYQSAKKTAERLTSDDESDYESEKSGQDSNTSDSSDDSEASFSPTGSDGSEEEDEAEMPAAKRSKTVLGNAALFEPIQRPARRIAGITSCRTRASR